ncbi:NosD domain-containing protein [Polyangium sp. 6x1]|uniref:NosD domain-containing protein n=1 Tax=Polyangium sp. 6x1 TaxID=3042689 RepID=UPI002482ECBC|nr:NosD domain-containing protein [Polyangium sp. 6x1]MDI1448753.1 NosD domain-containing protein [Polyangium sp. 6x1]
MLILSRPSVVVLLTSLALASAGCGVTVTGGGSSGAGPSGDGGGGGSSGEGGGGGFSGEAGGPGSNPPGPDPQIPPAFTEITVPLADVLQGRDGVLDIVRLFPDKPAVEQILPVSADTTSITLPFEGAGVLAYSLLGTQGALFESHGATSDCLPSIGQGIPEVLEVPNEFATIQAAIDAAAPGDRVFVHPGTYHEHLRLRSGVRLVGAGAWQTVLDGDGLPENLIDITGAGDVVVRGFTLRNVGQGQGCAQPEDPLLCGGNWYRAAIYGDGHDSFADTLGNPTACAETSIQITQNIIDGNDIGVMFYFHARGVIHNNIFVGNRVAFAGGYLNDYALVASNVFYDNTQLAIAGHSAYLDILNNVVVKSSVGVKEQYPQTGRIRCNVFFDVDNIGELVDFGEEAGNVILDPDFFSPADRDFRLGIDLGAAGLGCPAPGLHNVENASAEPGAFGGAMGGWHMQSITPADIVPGP